MREKPRFVSILVVVLAVAFGFTRLLASESEEIYDGQALENLASKARAFAPKDEFDLPPALPSLSGKRYSYVVAPLKRGPDNLICDGFPSWGYSPQDRRLEIGGTESQFIRSDLRRGNNSVMEGSVSDDKPFVVFRSFRCKKSNLPSYTAANAFGAPVNVFVSKESVTAIGDFGSPMDTSWMPYWATEVEGDAARALSKNARVRISGRLEDWAPGQPIRCGVTESLPRADFPFKDTLDICLFRGQADLFEVLDATTESVLFSSARN